MRIIHILNHVQEIGNGIVNVAVDLACLQAKSGYEVAVISAGGEYEKLLNNCGVKHYQLDQTRKPNSIIKAACALPGDRSRISAGYRSCSHDDGGNFSTYFSRK